MTRDEARGQSALKELQTGKYIEPQCYFIPSDGPDNERLYDLERKRVEVIDACAKQWAKIAAKRLSINEKEFWTRSLPQALHDTLETYHTPSAIIAAEAFLKRHGWKVERPELDPGLK